MLEWYSKQKECGVLSSSDISFLLPKIRQKSGWTLPLHTLSQNSPKSSRSTTTSIAISPLTQLACMALGAEDRSFSALSCSSEPPSSSNQESGFDTAAAELNRDFFFSLTVKEKEELAVFFLYRLGRLPEGINTNEVFDALLDAPHIEVIPRFLQEALFAEPSFLNHVHPKYLQRCFDLALSPLPVSQEAGENVHESYRDTSCQQDRKKQWIAWGERYLPSHHKRCVTLRKAGLWYEVMAYEHYSLSCFSSSSPLSRGSSLTKNVETVDEPWKQSEKEKEEKRTRKQKTTLYRRLLCTPLGWGRCPWEIKATQRVDVKNIFTGGFGPEMVALLSHPEAASDSVLTRLFRHMPPIILDFSLHLLLLSWARRSRSRRAVRNFSLGRCSCSTDVVLSSQNGRVAKVPTCFQKEEHGKSNKEGLGNSRRPHLLPIISDDSVASEKTTALLSPLDLHRELPHASSSSSFGFHLPEWLVKSGYFTSQSLLETMHYDLQEGSSWTAQGLLHRCHHRDDIAMLMQHTRNAGLEAFWQALTHWRKLFPCDTVYLVLRLPQEGKTWNRSDFRSARRRSAYVPRKDMVPSNPFTLILQLVPSIQNGPMECDRTAAPPSSSLSFRSLSAPSFHHFLSSSSTSTHRWPSSPATASPSSFSSAVSTAAAAAAVLTSSLLPPPSMKSFMWAVTSDSDRLRGSTPATGKSMSSILRSMPSLTSDVVEWFLALLLQKHAAPCMRKDGEREGERREGRDEDVLEKKTTKSGVRHCGTAVVRALDTAEMQEVVEVLMVAVERRITFTNTKILVDVLLSLATCATPPVRSARHTGKTFTPFLTMYSDTTEEERQTSRSGRERSHHCVEAQREKKTGKAFLFATTSAPSVVLLLRVARLYPKLLLPNGAEVAFQMAVRRAWKRYEEELQTCIAQHEEEETVNVWSTPAPIHSFSPSSKCFALFHRSSSPCTLGSLLYVSLQCGFFLGPAAFLSSLSRSLSLLAEDGSSHTTALRRSSCHSLCPTPSSTPSLFSRPSAWKSSFSAIFRVWRDVLEEMLLQSLFTFPSACTVTHNEPLFHSLPCDRHPRSVQCHLSSLPSPQPVGWEEKEPFHRSFSPSSSSSSVMCDSSLESLLQLLRELFLPVGGGVAIHKGATTDEERDRRTVSPIEMDAFLYDGSAVSPSPPFSKEDRRVFSRIKRTNICWDCCWWFSSHHATVPLSYTALSPSPFLSPPFSARHPTSSALDAAYSTAQGMWHLTQDAKHALRMPSVTHRLYRHRRCTLWPLALHDVRHRYHQWVTCEAKVRQAMTTQTSVNPRTERKRAQSITRDEGEMSGSGFDEDEWSAFFVFSWMLTRDIHKAVRLACVGLGYEANSSSDSRPQNLLHRRKAKAEESDDPVPLPSALFTIFTSAEEWLTELQKSMHFLCSSPKSSSYLSHRLQRAQDTMLQWTVFTAADVLRQKKYYQEATTWFLPPVENLPLCLQQLRGQCWKESRNGVDRKGYSTPCPCSDREDVEIFSHGWEEDGNQKKRTFRVSRWKKKRNTADRKCIPLSHHRRRGGKTRSHFVCDVQGRACGRQREVKRLNFPSLSVISSRLKWNGKRNTKGEIPPPIVRTLLAELVGEGK